MRPSSLNTLIASFVASHLLQWQAWTAFPSLFLTKAFRLNATLGHAATQQRVLGSPSL
jgi:hypothetical protein